MEAKKENKDARDKKDRGKEGRQKGGSSEDRSRSQTGPGQTGAEYGSDSEDGSGPAEEIEEGEEETVEIPFRLLELLTEHNDELLARNEFRDGTTEKNTYVVGLMRSASKEARKIIEEHEEKK